MLRKILKSDFIVQSNQATWKAITLYMRGVCIDADVMFNDEKGAENFNIDEATETMRIKWDMPTTIKIYTLGRDAKSNEHTT